MTVGIYTDDGLKQYDQIKDAIAISGSTIRVVLEDGRKAKKDGWLFGATDGKWDVTVERGSDVNTHKGVSPVLTMPDGTVKIGGTPIGTEIKRLKRHDS